MLFDPFIQIVPPAERVESAATDWPAVKARIIAGLDVRAEFEALGVRFTGKEDRDGWKCFGFGREDGVPSAVVFRSGVYKDSGAAEKATHLIEFAAKHGRFGGWKDAMRHYAAQAGVELAPIKLMKGGKVLERTFDYRDAAGQVVYRVYRKILPNGRKDFSQHPIRPSGDVVYEKGAMDRIAWYPYRYPELLCHKSERENASDVNGNAGPAFLFLSEGEKAAEAIAALGLASSTGHGGVGMGRKVWDRIASHFADLDVVVLPDRDKEGGDHAEMVCARLADIARSVRRLDLPGLPPKGDAVEWIEAGGTRDQLEALAEACPVWVAGAETEATEADALLGLPAARDDLPDESDLDMVFMSDVKPVAVEWLIPGRVPVGKLTLLAGEQKIGKSFLTMDLIARITTGGEIPGSPGECMPQGSVVLLSAEDDKADTIRPRLDAAGADASLVACINTVKKPDGKFAPFSLAYVGYLELTMRLAARRAPLRMVLIDPVDHYARSGVDNHKNVQVREMLEPLRELAERYRVAVVIICHMNKSTGTRAIHRVMGSNAYTALCRANWLVIRDADNLDRRLLLSMGCNLVKDPTGLAYTIDEEGRVVWDHAPVFTTADEASVAFNEATAAEKSPKVAKSKLAEDWLASQFADRTPILSDTIFERAESEGFGRSTIFAAKKKLGIEAKKQLGADGKFLWLPPTDPHVVVPFPITGCSPSGLNQ